MVIKKTKMAADRLPLSSDPRPVLMMVSVNTCVSDPILSTSQMLTHFKHTVTP